jgi:hypothetical protein
LTPTFSFHVFAILSPANVMTTSTANMIKPGISGI